MAARSTSKTKERAATLERLGYMAEERLATMLEIKVVSLRNRRDLPTRHKLGKHSVYRIADVQAWMARRAVAA